MRSQSNGIVTDNEQRMLTEIIKMQLLPDDAINIALYELTAVEHRTSLNKGLMQTIVNDWAQAGVRSARDALKYLKKRQQGATQQNISGRSQKTWRRPVAKETRPDWENQSAEKASDELMREAQATLEKLKKED
jgi:replication initiation and membrane attachment protein